MAEDAARLQQRLGASDRIRLTEYLDGVQRVELSLRAPGLLRAMDEIEAYRAGFVRGDLDGGQQVAARCRRLLEVIRRDAMVAEPLQAQS